MNDPRLSLSVCPHLIFLVDFGGEDEGGERDASQVLWLSLKTQRFTFNAATDKKCGSVPTPKDRGQRVPGVTVKPGALYKFSRRGSLPQVGELRSGLYLDSGQQAVQDADSQGRGLWTEVEQPAHLSEPKDHFSVLRRRDVCALRGGRRPRSVTRSQRLKDTWPQCLTWMDPFLKTGAFQRRASLSRAASSRTTSRRRSVAPGFFMVTRAQARLEPGHLRKRRGGTQVTTFRRETRCKKLEQFTGSFLLIFLQYQRIKRCF